MAEDIQQARDDISYIRGLMGDDRSALFAVGVGMETCGLVFGLSTLRYFVQAMNWDLPAALTAVMPWDAIALFFIILVPRMRFAAKETRCLKPGRALPAGSALSRAVVAAWQAMGAGYLVVLISLWAAGAGGGSTSAIVAFVLWGGGWLVTYAAYRRNWQILVALGCYGMAILLGFLGGAWAALIAAAGLFLLVALPGHLVLNEARSARAEG